MTYVKLGLYQFMLSLMAILVALLEIMAAFLQPQRSKLPQKPEAQKPKKPEVVRLGFWALNPTRKPESLARTIRTIVQTEKVESHPPVG